MHISWSAASHSELAVVDSVGRICILAFSTSLNRPFCIRSWEPDPVDDLHAVVACYWLPLMPPNKQVLYTREPQIAQVFFSKSYYIRLSLNDNK